MEVRFEGENGGSESFPSSTTLNLSSGVAYDGTVIFRNLPTTSNPEVRILTEQYIAHGAYYRIFYTLSDNLSGCPQVQPTDVDWNGLPMGFQFEFECTVSTITSGTLLMQAYRYDPARGREKGQERPDFEPFLEIPIEIQVIP